MNKEWLDRYEQVKDLLISPVHFRELFAKDAVDDKKLFVLPMGEVNFPTGEILARDPLAYLNRRQIPYLQKVPAGKYPLETLVVEMEENHYRYIATRVVISDHQPVVYQMALNGDEDLAEVDKDSLFGFAVDAGLATIVDIKTLEIYCDFKEKWEESHSEGNLYDDFFASEFAKNYEKNPAFQRPGGDWINYRIPDTELSVPMIQSGFGDGQYPVYFGIDDQNQVCEVAMEYIFVG